MVKVPGRLSTLAIPSFQREFDEMQLSYVFRHPSGSCKVVQCFIVWNSVQNRDFNEILVATWKDVQATLLLKQLE